MCIYGLSSECNISFNSYDYNTFQECQHTMHKIHKQHKQHMYEDFEKQQELHQSLIIMEFRNWSITTYITAVSKSRVSASNSITGATTRTFANDIDRINRNVGNNDNNNDDDNDWK